MGMKNDLSFIVRWDMNLYAHQSTYNPNMPVRELMYLGHLYSKYITENKLNIYGSRQIPLPVPKLIVFYNGNKDTEDEVMLELKDSFPPGANADESDVNVRVRMLNVNYGRNKRIPDHSQIGGDRYGANRDIHTHNCHIETV